MNSPGRDQSLQLRRVGTEGSVPARQPSLERLQRTVQDDHAPGPFRNLPALGIEQRPAPQRDDAPCRTRGTLSRGGDIPVATVLDVAQTPDLYPVLAATAAALGREVAFTGTERLRLKESDRIASTAALIEAVKTGKPVNTYGDHRIAMSAAVMACYAKRPVTVEGAECVAKSYPGFWDDFEQLKRSEWT